MRPQRGVDLYIDIYIHTYIYDRGFSPLTSTPKDSVLLPHPCGVVVAGAVGSQKALKKDDDANDHDGPDEDDDEENHE